MEKSLTYSNAQVCFVVMGYGTKTDYEKGRKLDLDATFRAIIAPAVESAGLRCVRSDQIQNSGVIDLRMYEMLLRADLVIADISTGNGNAIYELGVRHALRPRSTIIMKETVGRFYFDLNHSSTFLYEHLGIDIGHSEAVRAQKALADLIRNVLGTTQPDSPVYTFLPQLQQPYLAENDYRRLLDETQANQAQLSAFIQAGQHAFKVSDHEAAADAFAKAVQIKPDDNYLVQQLALATYKAQKPTKLAALIEGLRLIDQLDPDHSNDPETLGIAGAIRKRLWQETMDPAQLNTAIRYYRRGFEVSRDYYNGENLAVCYDFRSKLHQNGDERVYDTLSARKVRAAIIEILTPQVNSPSFDQRTDQSWVFATLANCYFATGNSDLGRQYEERFFALNPAVWEQQTYHDGKSAVLNK